MKKLFFICALFLIGLWGFDALAYTSLDCIRCHTQESKESVLHISLDKFDVSIHGREITCDECHTNIEDKTHLDIKGSGGVDCGECHEEEDKHGNQPKSDNRLECVACHPKHRMLEKENPASAVHPDQLKKTCMGCHPVECGETDYVSWLPSLQIMSHKKRDFSQTYEKGNCVGCHQGQVAHGEKKPINKQNCHLCHMKMKDAAAVMGYIHARADSGKQPAIFVSAILYQISLLMLLWGGFRFYTLKFSGKLKKRRT